jgi:hypothetical protein
MMRVSMPMETFAVVVGVAVVVGLAVGLAIGLWRR